MCSLDEHRRRAPWLKESTLERRLTIGDREMNPKRPERTGVTPTFGLNTIENSNIRDRHPRRRGFSIRTSEDTNEYEPNCKGEAKHVILPLDQFFVGKSW